MPSLNLALSLRVIRRSPDMTHPLALEPKRQLLRDVAWPGQSFVFKNISRVLRTHGMDALP